MSPAMVFAWPLALLGLTALPLLAAVYWLRSRSRRVVVSSLMLWVDQRRARQGGRMFSRMQAPLTFFLELAALALLAVAAAGPAIVARQDARPLVVVLDDSFSMLAGETSGRGKSPRSLAETALAEELDRGNYLARFILAGAEPRLVGQGLSGPQQTRAVTAAWTCQSPWADLARAIAVAAEIGGPGARVLVMSDHAPPTALDGGQVQWWAFGAALPNMAITAATRNAADERERALVEVTNLSDAPGRATLTLEGGHLAAAKKTAVELGPGAARQFFLDLPVGSPALRASLGGDALEIDNRVTLLPAPAKPLRVSVDISEAKLREAVRRVLDSTGMALQSGQRPELVVADKPGTVQPGAWRLEILGGREPTAYAGPFVIDRTHPLAGGLSLEGVVWSRAAETELGGTPIITAGNVPLATDSEQPSGAHRVQVALAAEVSNLAEVPDWPILFANLLKWRRGALPGIAAPNARLGQTVSVTLADDIAQVELRPPAGPAVELEVHGRRVEAPAEMVGLHTLRAGEAEYRFASNAVSRDESDLADAAAGQWGSWRDSPIYQDRHVGFGWLLLLVALAAMTAHMTVVFAEARGACT